MTHAQLPIFEKESHGQRPCARNSTWNCKNMIKQKVAAIMVSTATHCVFKHFDQFQENNNGNNILYCIIYCLIWYTITKMCCNNA